MVRIQEFDEIVHIPGEGYHLSLWMISSNSLPRRSLTGVELWRKSTVSINLLPAALTKMARLLFASVFRESRWKPSDGRTLPVMVPGIWCGWRVFASDRWRNTSGDARTTDKERAPGQLKKNQKTKREKENEAGPLSVSFVGWVDARSPERLILVASLHFSDGKYRVV
jgi:hypothetical protein